MQGLGLEDPDGKTRTMGRARMTQTRGRGEACGGDGMTRMSGADGPDASTRSESRHGGRGPRTGDSESGRGRAAGVGPAAAQDGGGALSETLSARRFEGQPHEPLRRRCAAPSGTALS